MTGHGAVGARASTPSIIIVGADGTPLGVSPTTIGEVLGAMAGTTATGTMVGVLPTTMVAGTLPSTTILLAGTAIHVLRIASVMAQPQVATHGVASSTVRQMIGDVV